MSDKATIYERMLRVMNDIGAVPKTRKAGGLQYAFRGIDDVMAALNPACCEHGVFLLPEVREVSRDTYQTNSGTTMQLVGLTVAFHFVGEGGDDVTAIAYGEGSDVGDKAAYKAMAGALKYALTQTFVIPTEEAKDAEIHTNEGPQNRPKASGAPKPPAAPIPVARGEEPPGLDQLIEFGKFKKDAITWRDCMNLGNASPDGGHAGWLRWLSTQPAKEGKYAEEDAARKVMTRWIVREIDTEARPGGEIGEPPPPTDDDIVF